MMKNDAEIMVKLDQPLKEWFQSWCQTHRETMSGWLRRQIVELCVDETEQETWDTEDF